MEATDKNSGMTQELLKKLLHYDPESGVFTWLVQPRRAVYPGARAGHVHKGSGYFLIKIDGRNYLGSRLAWLYMTGDWPQAMVDHENMDRADTRWDNLRAATRKQNCANRAAAKSKKLPIKGVYERKNGNSGSASIRVDGRLIHLGTFKTPQLASEAYSNAAHKHYGEFARSA